jgi:hypothetical protein
MLDQLDPYLRKEKYDEIFPKISKKFLETGGICFALILCRFYIKKIFWKI